MKLEKNKLITDLQMDAFQIRFVKSPNVGRSFKGDPDTIYIHYTAGSSTEGAVSTFSSKQAGTSAHFIIDKNGEDVVQMVDIDREAYHAAGRNNNAIGIELDYPGYLLPNVKDWHYRSLKQYPNDGVLVGKANNDWRYNIWPLYPDAQMNTLDKIVSFLVQNFEIKRIVGHEETHDYKLDPGPAFPINFFRQKHLRGHLFGEVLEEMNQDVVLKTAPASNAQEMVDADVKEDTFVTIRDERGDWVLIEVMQSVDDRENLLGWVKKEVVSADVSVSPVVHLESHLLRTGDGRRYRRIVPANTNFNTRKTMKSPNPRFLIMHITTGIKMSSTINHFKRRHTYVSTHLLVGRDGRVVQFLPFDAIAYHAGESFWDGKENLNFNSIGMEIDNVGPLWPKDNTQWEKSGQIIPLEDTELVRHWKSRTERRWHKFRRDQLVVARKIAFEILKKYKMEDILSHDAVNLMNRMDPGPLFPIQEWREEFFGRKYPLAEVWETKKDTAFYENLDYKPPKPKRREKEEFLGFNTTIQVLEKRGKVTLVQVRERQGNGSTGWGWILSRYVKPLVHKTPYSEEQNLFSIRENLRLVRFYRTGGKRILPTLRHAFKTLPSGENIRILRWSGKWALITNADRSPKYAYIVGWVLARDLKLVGKREVTYEDGIIKP